MLTPRITHTIRELRNDPELYFRRLNFLQGNSPGPRSREIHIWNIDLDNLFASQELLAGVLSNDESERAAAFRFDLDRHRFTLGRSILRHLISQYLHVLPASVVFEYSERGKPSLPEGHSLRFNVAHSQNIGVFAFRQGSEIGIDVEIVASKRVDPRIGQPVFSPSELSLISEAPTEQQYATFLRCWTRKEAYAKATGLGIADDILPKLTLTGSSAVKHAQSRGANWTIIDLGVRKGTVSALATMGDIDEIKHFTIVDSVSSDLRIGTEYLLHQFGH